MNRNRKKSQDFDRYKKYRINKRKRNKRNKASWLGVLVIVIISAALVYGCYNSDIFRNGNSSSEKSSSISNPNTSSNDTNTSGNLSSQISSESETPPGYPFSELEYYISSRFERYIDFSEKNPDFSIEEVVLRVNMNFDYDFYEMVYPVENPDDKLVICNKYYKLPEDFVPANLKEIPEDYHIQDNKEYYLDETALNAFIEMALAAKEEGLELKILSSYRSYSYQQGLYNTYVSRDGIEAADTYSARAGHSEHQTGLAVDVNLLTQDFENFPEFIWLRDNSYKFGFILRYKQGYEWETGYMYEPWHYRYVGKEVSKQIFDEDITYDRYYAKYILPFKN